MFIDKPNEIPGIKGYIVKRKATVNPIILGGGNNKMYKDYSGSFHTAFILFESMFGSLFLRGIRFRK